VRPLQNREKGILEHILRLDRITRDAQSQPEQGGRCPVEELAKSRRVTRRCDADDQRTDVFARHNNS
jgi:hypothetical protein